MYKYIEKLKKKKQIFYRYFYTNNNKELKQFTELYKIYFIILSRTRICVVVVYKSPAY